MSFYKKRSECPICEKNKKKFIFKYLNMPIFISTKIGKNTHDLYCDQTYVKCLSCNCVFIDEIIDASILYSWNHNANPVGKLWQRHFEKFKNFILNQVSSNEIIEIGGASGKLAKMFENYNEINKWEIIEPNPPDDYYESNKIKLNKIRIEDYVLENNTKDIVMSHVFEHFVNPTKILELIREKSRIGTNVIISIPNLENIQLFEFTEHPFSTTN